MRKHVQYNYRANQDNRQLEEFYARKAMIASRNKDMVKSRPTRVSLVQKSENQRIRLKPYRSLLIEFLHGLGDCVEYGIVIKHLKYHYPNLEISVKTKPGRQWALNGIADHVYSTDHKIPPHDFTFHEPFNYPNISWLGVPSTKVTKTLIDNFGIFPREEFFTYEFHPSEHAINSVNKLQKDVLNKPYAVLHYQGDSSKDRKDLTHQEAKQLCSILNSRGLNCVMADYFNPCPFADNKNIISIDKNHPWLWHGEPDSGILYEIIKRASLFIGIDSGPSHVAGATKTPSYILWLASGYHPIIAFDLADNCTHLVPTQFVQKQDFGTDYFLRKYKHLVYTESNLLQTITASLESPL